MARLARVVVPGCPHHVTQRGNRRLATFFSAADYAAYLDLLAEACGRAGTAVWAYCLMPDHVHLVLVPSHGDGLRAALGEAHRRYSRAINLREGWRGHLWQERFHSFPVDEAHLAACVRHVERNPVRAGLARRLEDWRWSSARARLKGREDPLLDAGAPLGRGAEWRAYLRKGTGADEAEFIRRHGRTGRPLGEADFVARLEAALGRPLAPRRPGRPRKAPQPGTAS